MTKNSPLIPVGNSAVSEPKERRSFHPTVIANFIRVWQTSDSKLSVMKVTDFDYQTVTSLASFIRQKAKKLNRPEWELKKFHSEGRKGYDWNGIFMEGFKDIN